MHKWLAGVIMSAALLTLIGCSEKQSSEEINETSGELMTIENVEKNVESDFEELKKSKTKLVFNDKTRLLKPEFDVIDVFKTEDVMITLDEAVSYIDKCAEEIGVEINESDIYDAKYPAESARTDEEGFNRLYLNLKDSKEKGSVTGEGVHVLTLECYLSFSKSGIEGYDDGRLSRYRKEKYKPSWSASGPNPEDCEAMYSLDEITDDMEYELADGPMKVKDAIAITEDYFNTVKDPFPPADGVSTKVYEVWVFKVGDNYAYWLRLQRVWKKADFEPIGNAGSYTYRGMVFDEDNKGATVSDSSGVCSYMGYNESMKIIVGEESDKMLSLKDAVDICEQKLGNEMKLSVKEVRTGYVRILEKENKSESEPTSYEEHMAADYRMYWIFEGSRKTDGYGMKIFVDALSGDIYYQEFHG